jgi:hypothetical protein
MPLLPGSNLLPHQLHTSVRARVISYHYSKALNFMPHASKFYYYFYFVLNKTLTIIIQQKHCTAEDASGVSPLSVSFSQTVNQFIATTKEK